MFGEHYFILVSMGGFFTLLGLVAIIRARAEEKSYYDFQTTRSDVKEFLENDKPISLKAGGWIAVAIGLFLLAMGGGLWLWG